MVAGDGVQERVGRMAWPVSGVGVEALGAKWVSPG